MQHPLTQQAVDYRNAALGLIDLRVDQTTAPDELAKSIITQSQGLKIRLERLDRAVAEHFADAVRAYDAQCSEILQKASHIEQEAAEAEQKAVDTLRELYGDAGPVVHELAVSRGMRPVEAVKLGSQARSLRDQAELLERPVDRPAPVDKNLSREQIAEMSPERITQSRAAIFATATK